MAPKLKAVASKWLRPSFMALLFLGLFLAYPPQEGAQWCWQGDSCEGLEGCVPYRWTRRCDFDCDPICTTAYCSITYYRCASTVCSDWECVWHF
jgi:hypothetical protein